VYQKVTQFLPGSFEAFYHGTSGRLLRYAYGLTGDMAEAQDFTQEAYARAWQRWMRLRDYDNPESWLRLVVTRLATDRWRWLGLRRQSTRPAGGDAGGDAFGDAVPGPSEDLVLLITELKRLPMQQRRALVLHYLLDRPVADIAEETGVSINTVKSWLLRGRANLAAQLAEPALPAQGLPAQGLPAQGLPAQGLPAQGLPAQTELFAETVPVEAIEARGRRAKRRRATMRSIIAFLTTAAATAAYFLFGQVPPPEPIGPDQFVPYGYEPRIAVAALDEQRAYLSWHGVDGQSKAGIIDLKRNKLIGKPIDLGRWDDMFGLVGLGDGGVHFLGANDSGNAQDWALFTVDPNTGQLLWRYNSEAQDAARFVLRQAVVFVQAGPNGHVTALDTRTGRPKWTLDEPLADVTVRADGQRLALLSPDGTLRVRDPATGRVLNELSGVPVPPPRGQFLYMLIEDYLYVSTEDSVSRLALAGGRQAQKIAEFSQGDVAGCGGDICVGGIAPPGEPSQVIILDKASGRELRRLKARMLGRPETSARGMIFLGEPLGSSIVYDFQGVGISPPDMAGRTAHWFGDDRLLLIRGKNPGLSDGGPGAAAENAFVLRAELSVYSFETRKETSLGEVVLRGDCGTAKAMIVCPTETGFRTYH